MPEIGIIVGDVLTHPADVLVLKYAASPHGADAAVANALGVADFALHEGKHGFWPSNGVISAREVLVLGVGPLHRFEYRQIRAFAERAVDIVRTERPSARRVTLTLHGPGYGLDELAAIDNLVGGITSGLSRAPQLQVQIVERSPKRAARIEAYCGRPSVTIPIGDDFSPKVARQVSADQSYTRRLFAALPFKEQFLDHWEFAIRAAAHEEGFVCERLDHEFFTGDIVTEIKNRIEKSRAVVALLDEFNANVFLEVGYAWGVNKPTLLILNESAEPPFDVRSQNIIRYARLVDLKESLSRAIKALSAQGKI